MKTFLLHTIRKIGLGRIYLMPLETLKKKEVVLRNGVLEAINRSQSVTGLF